MPSYTTGAAIPVCTFGAFHTSFAEPPSGLDQLRPEAEVILGGDPRQLEHEIAARLVTRQRPEVRRLRRAEVPRHLVLDEHHQLGRGDDAVPREIGLAAEAAQHVFGEVRVRPRSPV